VLTLNEDAECDYFIPRLDFAPRKSAEPLSSSRGGSAIAKAESHA